MKQARCEARGNEAALRILSSIQGQAAGFRSLRILVQIEADVSVAKTPLREYPDNLKITKTLVQLVRLSSVFFE